MARHLLKSANTLVLQRVSDPPEGTPLVPYRNAVPPWRAIQLLHLTQSDIGTVFALYSIAKSATLFAQAAKIDGVADANRRGTPSGPRTCPQWLDRRVILTSCSDPERLRRTILSRLRRDASE
jgi:hypothetical protein